MDLWRKYMWVWVIVGMVFVSLVIILIFLLINKCISRGGIHRISQLQRKSDFKVQSNKYQERNPEAVTPPLPPRTQFLTAEAQSYENLREVPDYEQSANQQSDYVKVEDEVDILPPPPPPYDDPDTNVKCGVSVAQSYENLAEEPDYEQSADQQPDYVKVEILRPPPADPSADSTSTEDYDDIGGEDEGEEDYDDVG